MKPAGGGQGPGNGPPALGGRVGDRPGQPARGARHEHPDRHPERAGPSRRSHRRPARTAAAAHGVEGTHRLTDGSVTAGIAPPGSRRTS